MRAVEFISESPLKENTGKVWVSDTELDQYVPDQLFQEWRELLGYDEDGRPHPLWANMIGGYEPDVRDPEDRANMVRVANKWFAMKHIPNVKFFDVLDAEDELEWLVQVSPASDVAETTGDNKFDAMMGTMQGNAELLKSVMAEFLTIYYGALDEEDMTDHIAYNLGDFFNGVKRSRDPVLQKSYAYVRDLAEEDVDVQANGTLRAIRMMLGDPVYTPPPKPPMSSADQAWVDRLVNAMTAALASHGIKAHPNWNKKT